MSKKKVPRRGDAYHHGDLRNALVRTARVVVDEVGVEALSLREVARRLGVTQAAPYHHFASKEDLVAGVAEEGFRELYAAQLAALDGVADDPRERIAAIGVAYVRFAVAHAGHFEAMFRRPPTPNRYAGIGVAAQACFSLLRNLVRECGGDDVDAVQGWSTVHGLATLWLDGPLRRNPAVPRDLDALAHRVIGTYATHIGNRRKV